MLVIGENMLLAHSPRARPAETLRASDRRLLPQKRMGEISPRTASRRDGKSVGGLSETTFWPPEVRERMPEEAARGLMHWYGKQDSLDTKVRFSPCSPRRSGTGELWGVAECQVVGDLSREELTTLKDYIAGQASDGWGEGFEQREIRVDGGELYVHLWTPDNWSIQTGQERFGHEPERSAPRQRGPRKNGMAR